MSMSDQTPHISQTKLKNALEWEKDQELRLATPEDSYFKILVSDLISTFESGAHAATGGDVMGLARSGIGLLFFPFKVLAHFFKYFVFVIIRFLILNFIVYFMLASPLTFLAYKFNTTPPISLWLPISTFANTHSFFGFLASMIQDIQFLVIYNTASLILLIFSLVPLRGPLILITRAPSLIILFIINLVAVLTGIIGGEFLNTLQSPMGDLARVHELFFLPPMYVALIMLFFMGGILAVRPYVDDTLRVNANLNAVGEEHGSFVSTLFGLNNLRTNTVTRGFRMGEDQTPKMDWSIPLFYDALELLKTVLAIRWRTIQISLLITIVAGVYFGNKLRNQGPSLFEMTPKQRTAFFRKDCIANSKDVAGLTSIFNEDTKADILKSSETTPVDFLLTAKKSVTSMKKKYFQANVYVQNQEGSLAAKCNNDIREVVLIFAQLKNTVGLQSLLDGNQYQQAFNGLVSSKNDFKLLKDPDFVPVVYQAVYEMAHSYNNKLQLSVKARKTGEKVIDGTIQRIKNGGDYR